MANKDFEWEDDINANEEIEEALVNLDCWIDCCKEDGSTYNAIGWWNMLETFRECKDDLELYKKKYDMALNELQNSNFISPFVSVRSDDMEETWNEYFTRKARKELENDKN